MDPPKKLKDREVLHLLKDWSLPAKHPDSAELSPAFPMSSLSGKLSRGTLFGMCPREYWVVSTKVICSDWLFTG